MSTTPATDDYVANNETYAASFTDGDLAGPPARSIAVVTCMDARIDVTTALGLDNGDAHVLRNAGGIVTDDTIRSLCLSQRALGTREIMLIHHTKCGVQGIDEAAFRRDLAAEVGAAPTWSVGTFDDVEDERSSIRPAAAAQPLRAPHRPDPRLRVRRRDRPTPRSRHRTADRLGVAGEPGRDTAPHPERMRGRARRSAVPGGRSVTPRRSPRW